MVLGGDHRELCLPAFLDWMFLPLRFSWFNIIKTLSYPIDVFSSLYISAGMRPGNVERERAEGTFPGTERLHTG